MQYIPAKIFAARFRRSGWLLALWATSSTAYAANGCLPEHFLDRRGESILRIANDDPTNPFRYRPRCVTVSEGTRIEFEALPNFGMHPLYGGTVSAGQATIDPDSPIGSVTQGEIAVRVLIDAGEWPFFCDIHFDQGMLGSIRVVPELFADGFDGAAFP